MRFHIRPYILTESGKLRFEILLEYEDSNDIVSIGTVNSYERAQKIIRANERIAEIQKEYSFIDEEEEITIQ